MIREPLDPLRSTYIALAPLIERLEAALASPGAHAMKDLVALVGADWNIGEAVKARVVRLAIEWGQCAARPKVIEVNGNVIRTRRPRFWVAETPAEVVYSPEEPEES